MTVHVGDLRSRVSGEGAPAAAAPRAPESPWEGEARLCEQLRALDNDRRRTRAEGYDD
jgi:hypothetical protein